MMRARFAIGIPGGRARMVVEGTPTFVARQLRAGEVAVRAGAALGALAINADGTGCVAVQPTPEEGMFRVRAMRFDLLTACDWTQIPDSPLSPEQREAWAVYRAALRDLPATQPDATPATVIWPEPPTS